jgi:queuine/archaeosine tRNA-ribosyltransferase
MGHHHRITRIENPHFYALGTRARLKAMLHRDLRGVKQDHTGNFLPFLYLRPGLEVLSNAGGCTASSWDKPG